MIWRLSSPQARAILDSLLVVWDTPRNVPSPRFSLIGICCRRARVGGRCAHIQQRGAFHSRGSKQRATEFNDIQEEATRAAILEKVMKGRQPTDLMLRCNVKTISGQFKKSDLYSSSIYKPRDLRKIDSRVPNLVPTILIRREAFLVNILHIRALVKADTVILFDTFGSADSRLHSVFLYHLEHNLKTKGLGLPYEFRALESILLSVVSALEAEMVFIRNLVEEALDEVLAQDDDLTAMYLTDKTNDITRELDDHEDLEVLLESFNKQVEEIVNEAENIESASPSAHTNVQSTQEIVELILDSNRNALLALDLKVSIITMGIGSGAMVAGIFGMNVSLTRLLQFSIAHARASKTHPWAFYGMTGFATALVAVVALSGLRILAKIRKVGLSNTSNSSQRGRRRPWLPLPLRQRTPAGWS
ncbi:magnesium transporter [Favolaschia claudopus]|uniref:Magnesium transporter n=1 Tax=Favolaschia claudopus TaxID=2862362 RepID=A0AAW0DUE3_9AGAR